MLTTLTPSTTTIESDTAYVTVTVGSAGTFTFRITHVLE